MRTRGLEARLLECQFQLPSLDLVRRLHVAQCARSAASHADGPQHGENLAGNRLVHAQRAE